MHRVNLNRYSTFFRNRLKTRTPMIIFLKPRIETGFDSELTGFAKFWMGHGQFKPNCCHISAALTQAKIWIIPKHVDWVFCSADMHLHQLWQFCSNCNIASLVLLFSAVWTGPHQMPHKSYEPEPGCVCTQDWNNVCHFVLKAMKIRTKFYDCFMQL